MSFISKEHMVATFNACARAKELGVRWEGCENPQFTLMLDLENTLKFEEVLRLNNFKDADFAHDIIGIQNNFNRETMIMENCFVPRCHIKEG